MRKHTWAVLLVTALMLTGCSAPTATPAAEPTASATETPTPTPTPTPTEIVLTDAEAADLYLSIVCDNNAAINKLADAYSAGEDELLNGGNPDPKAVNAAAKRRIELNRMTLEVLDDEYYVWPAPVAVQLKYIHENYLGELSSLNTMASEDFETGYYTGYPASTPEQRDAGQQIRYELGLDANTQTSCKGHTGKLEALHKETVGRDTADS